MTAPRQAGPRLDEATLYAVADRLRAAGGCDRAVGLVEELAKGPEAPPIFNAVQATLSYVRARGAAPEDDVLRAVQAHEEEHAERIGEDSPGAKPLAVLRVILALVTRGDLVRDGNVVRRSRPAVDTRRGCVERGIEPRRVAT